MKKALSYMMLIVYTTMLLQPVLPFIIDFAAHIIQYEEHVKTIHFEHGNYHVHDEFKEAAKKAPVDNETNQPKKEKGSPEFIITKDVANTLQSSSRLSIYIHFSPDIYGRDLPHDYPPPRC